MDLIRSFIKNFIYGGLISALILTLIDIIKDSNKNIAFYAFLSGSFILINLMQYYYIDDGNNNNTNVFLKHSIIGGIIWVFYSITMYYLYKFKINKNINIFIIVLLTVITTFIYYILLANETLKASL